MWTSSTYRQIFEEGRRQGRERAREEGFLAGLREAILLIGSRRFGPAPDETRRLINHLYDRELLERLSSRVFDVSDWGEIVKIVNDSTRMCREIEIPNPDVAAHAEQFADAAVLLYQSLERTSCVPSVLLEGSLAIELYLKSLCSTMVPHEIDGMPGLQLTATPVCQNHRLDELFDAIDGEIQGELQEAYSAGRVVPGTSLLRDALARYRTMFVDVRYLFERLEWSGGSITDLIQLVKFFRKHVASMPLRVRTAS